MKTLYCITFSDGHVFTTRQARSAVEAIEMAYDDQVPYDALVTNVLRFRERDNKVERERIQWN